MSAPSVAGPRQVPGGDPVFEFLLRLGDDRLVLGHRVSEWCGHGPILEEDIALTNIALDLVGQASALLALAGEVEGQGRDADALAYFRDETMFRNAQMVELPRGDFGFTIVRQFLFDAYSVQLWGTVRHSSYAPLAALAEKSLKEDKYHLRHSSEWVVKLGDGTDESHMRAQAALDRLWRFAGELFEADPLEAALKERGIALDVGAMHATWLAMVSDVVKRATLRLPDAGPTATGGRRGRHTEFLGHMLAEMQIIARSHPGAKW